MKTQVIVVHGGNTFSTHEEYLTTLKSREVTLESFKSRKDWKDFLEQRLGEKFEILLPRMPNGSDAKYEEWKIWFERMFPFLEDNLILIGHSLGGIFLAKYLSENVFPKKIRSVFLIAAPFDDKDFSDSLADFSLGEDLSKMRAQAAEIFLFHSKDDPVVPFADLQKYQNSLPDAKPRVFEDRGHFNQEEFPELVEEIKKLV